MFEPLERPDSFYVEAAEGWLELGNHLEAKAELEKVAVGCRAHPAVLRVRWGVYAAAKDWEAALSVAVTLTQLDPEEPSGWVHRSYSLHELKRTTEARDVLLVVVERFPISATMRYNLACYECQLGRLDLAKAWLQKAFVLGDTSQMKAAALQDPDLEPLWKEIETL